MNRISKIALAVMALPAVAAGLAMAGARRARRDAREEAREMLAEQAVTEPDIVMESELDGLPGPVIRWLRYSGVVGHKRVRTVRLRQKGILRPEQTTPWMPFEAEQYFTTGAPGFLWFATVYKGPVPILVARDRFVDGNANMRIKAGGWLTIGDTSGPELDQAALVRYMSEIIWFPSAALQKYISWTSVDDSSALATIRYGGLSASALFTFDDAGRPIDFSADRYRALETGYSLDKWSTKSSAHVELEGVRMPIKGAAVWHLPEGDFPWLRLEVTEVESDVADAY